METTIQAVQARRGQRVLVMSDLHGHAENFLRVLQKARCSADDVLVIVGDLIDKGPESLRTLRCVMRLAQARPVYVSMGNVELSRLEILLDERAGGGARFADFIRWQQSRWGGGLLPDMLRESGFDPARLTAENADEVRARLRAHFAPEIEFLRTRPAILTMGNYIFVHGGVPTDDVEGLAGTDALPWLKNDSFYTQGHRFARCVVVGHWPVNLYRAGCEDCNPLMDFDRRIICMDGGCGLKQTGQLNALIFPGPDAPMEDIRQVYADSLPTVTALDAQPEAPPSIDITYLDSRVEPLEAPQGMLVHCRQVSTGREVWLPAPFLYGQDGGPVCFTEDYIDAQLAVQAGDTLSVMVQTERGIYARRNGVLGWYAGRWAEMSLPPAPAPEEFL